jgi:methionine-rich copper-binding protein CopC
MRSISIKVSKTVQIASYEPVTVEVVETAPLTDDVEANEKIRKGTYIKVTKALAEYMANEQAKWKRELKERKK